MFERFQHNSPLEAMLTFATWQSEFTEHDKQALVESLDTIRTAMIQPVGATADAKKRNSKCVTDMELDRAVMTVLATSMVLWLSGALDKTPCIGGAE